MLGGWLDYKVHVFVSLLWVWEEQTYSKMKLVGHVFISAIF